MERRDFYRIEDRIHLVKSPIEKHLISDNPYAETFAVPPHALLINQLQTLDNDARDLLRQVSDSNRSLGTYLRSMNDKIDLVARYVVTYDHDLKATDTVNLSEGGLSFYSDNAIAAESYMHLVMVLFPNLATMACIAVVKTCDKVDEHPTLYRIGTEFSVLLEQDRKQIVRHIRRRQTQDRVKLRNP